MNKKELIKKIEELENEEVTMSDLRRMFASLEGYEFGRLDKNKYSTFYVYIMYHNKKVLYIGRTTNIRDRFINHMKGNEYKEWKDTITHIEIYTIDCPYEMVSL